MDDVTAEDFGMVVFEYENGVSFAKTSAAETGGFMRRQLVVCGENGTREIKPIESYVKGTSDIETLYFDSGKNASWTEKANAQISAPFDRYDTMMRHFAEYVTGERENPYTYEYEAQLHKIVLAACGETIDYKSEVKL